MGQNHIYATLESICPDPWPVLKVLGYYMEILDNVFLRMHQFSRSEDVEALILLVLFFLRRGTQGL